jgi:hypothetical protein
MTNPSTYTAMTTRASAANAAVRATAKPSANLSAKGNNTMSYVAIICRRLDSDLITIWSRPETPEQGAIALQWCRDNRGDDYVFDLVSL